MPSGFKTELKLTGPPSALSALRRSFVIRALAVDDGIRDHFRTTYYDTPEGALARSGLSLSARRKDDGLLQTVAKANGALFQRREIETFLSAAQTFPWPTGEKAIDAKISVNNHHLVVETNIHTDRHTLLLRRGDALIEAAFEACVVDGAAMGDGRFAEVAFTLIEGDRRDLIALARLCQEEAAQSTPPGAPSALTVSTVTQHTRACVMLGVQPPSAPNRIPIDPDGDAGAALSAALELCAGGVLAAAPLVSAVQAPEGVKRLRVALRRFRSIERLFRKVAGDPALHALAEQARDYARVLGVARDWDVFVGETIPTIAEREGDFDGLDDLKAGAETLRMAAWNDAVDAVASAGFSTFAADLLNAAMAARTGKALRRPVRQFAEAALNKRLEQARIVGRTLDSEAPAAGHPLRIALKKMRYAAQLFRDLYPREARKPYMASMSYLQDGFGALNDAVVAQTLANRAAKGQGIDAARAAGFVCGYRAAEARDTARRIGESWAAFETYPPFWRCE